jgi:hypothetical protein
MTMCHYALLALLWGLAAGCATTPPLRDAADSAFDELRTQLRAEITGSARRDQLLAYVDALENLMILAVEEQRAANAELRALHANYDTTTEAFTAVFQRLNEQKSSRRQRLVEIAAEARALTTSEEWKRINRFKQLALEAALELNTHVEALP